MKPICITPKADRDIDECFSWIKKDNPGAAPRFIDAVENTCAILSENSGIGSRRYADIALVQGVRMMQVRGFDSYLLFYLEKETSIDTIRVLHGAHDIPEVLGS